MTAAAKRGASRPLVVSRGRTQKILIRVGFVLGLIAVLYGSYIGGHALGSQEYVAVERAEASRSAAVLATAHVKSDRLRVEAIAASVHKERLRFEATLRRFCRVTRTCSWTAGS